MAWGFGMTTQGRMIVLLGILITWSLQTCRPAKCEIIWRLEINALLINFWCVLSWLKFPVLYSLNPRWCHKKFGHQIDWELGKLIKYKCLSWRWENNIFYNHMYPVSGFTFFATIGWLSTKRMEKSKEFFLLLVTARLAVSEICFRLQRDKIWVTVISGFHVNFTEMF